MHSSITILFNLLHKLCFSFKDFEYSPDKINANKANLLLSILKSNTESEK